MCWLETRHRIHVIFHCQQAILNSVTVCQLWCYLLSEIKFDYTLIIANDASSLKLNFWAKYLDTVCSIEWYMLHKTNTQYIKTLALIPIIASPCLLFKLSDKFFQLLQHQLRNSINKSMNLGQWSWWHQWCLVNNRLSDQTAEIGNLLTPPHQKTESWITRRWPWSISHKNKVFSPLWILVIW